MPSIVKSVQELDNRGLEQQKMIEEQQKIISDQQTINLKQQEQMDELKREIEELKKKWSGKWHLADYKRGIFLGTIKK